MIKFATFTDDERAQVSRIIDRALPLFHDVGDPRTRRDIEMDLSAVHAAVPLRLEDLADADDFNFSHDLFGIARCLNRRTGRLEKGFLPRFAEWQKEPA